MVNNLIRFLRKYQTGGDVVQPYKPTVYSELPYDVNNIKGFYKDMLNSGWYTKRLYQNGYADQNTDIAIDTEGMKEASKVARTRWNAVNTAKFQEYSEPDSLWTQFRKTISGDDAIVDDGSFYSPSNNKVHYYKPQADELGAHPRTIITHEFGHAETDAGQGISQYEGDLLVNKLKKGVIGDHDKNPYENKSDINTVRYNLYRSGLFNPKTGLYKTKSGKFEKELLDKLNTDASALRLRDNYTDDDLTMLINTIAQNDSNNDDGNIAYAQNGGTISEIRNELNKLQQKYANTN